MIIITRNFLDKMVLINKANITYVEYNGKLSSIVHFADSSVVVKMSLEDISKAMILKAPLVQA